MKKKTKQQVKTNSVKVENNTSENSMLSLRTPVILLGLFSVIVLLHINVFSNFDEILSNREKETFLQLLNIRNLKLACLLILTLLSLIISIRSVKNKILSNSLSILLWLFLFFYGVEFYLSINPPSQGNGDAYVSKIWFKKYWETNKYGFRDKEYMSDELKYRKNLLLYLGDSFVAGHGIKNPEDRTANILEKSLNTKYNFINAGKNGLGSENEYGILRSFPGYPKVVILAHVPNDIEEILPAEKTYNKIYKSSSTPFIEFIYEHSRNSVFLDLFYHFAKIAGFKSQPEKGKDVQKSQITPVYDWYKTDSIFNKHLQTLQQIANYSCDTLKAKFILITYPESYDIDSCDIHINKKIIANIKPNKNIYFLNLTTVFKQTKNYNRSVNMFDGHPSKHINRIVADSLKNIMESEKFSTNK